VRGIEQGSEKLTIAFVGTINDYHPLWSVLAAFNQFLTRMRDARLELRFVGINRQKEVEELLTLRFPALVPYVRFFRKAPNAEAVEILATANAFLLFNEFAHPGTKIYEYMALKRKILLCFRHDGPTREHRREFRELDRAGMVNRRTQEDMIRSTESGAIIADERHLVDTVVDLYGEFSRNGRIACDSVGTEAYSRESHARRMADIIREVAGPRQT
jgi:glycosyltransferase involved in cell wall biosynthesis